jgi:hypothetical protein
MRCAWHVRVGWAAFGIVTAGCERGEVPLNLDNVLQAEACHEGSATVSPWAATRTVVNVSDPDGGLPSGGMAASTSGVFVFDSDLGEVWHYGFDLTVVGKFGRFGGGPGEFSRPLFHVVSSNWLDVRGDTVLVFDGTRITHFRSDGSVFRTSTGIARALYGGTPFVGRIHAGPGAVLFDLEVQRVYGRQEGDPEGRSHEVWAVSGETAERLLALPLPSLPQTGSATYRGGSEAQPRWAQHGRCGVFSDGSSQQLVVREIGSERADTLRFELPALREVPSRAELDRERSPMAQHGRVDGRTPPPAALAQIADLAVDPTGWVWIYPDRSRGETEKVVVQVNLATGAVRTDTVAVFPRAFLPDGSIVGIGYDEDRIPRLVRAVRDTTPR